MFHFVKQGAVKVIAGGGAPLTGENVVLAAAACEPLWSLGQPKLVFDLGAVPLIDSSGLELLLDLRDRCVERGGALVLAGPSLLICEILAATGLLSSLSLYDDVVMAAGSFAQ